MHKELDTKFLDFEPVIKMLKDNKKTNNKYDCITGISGDTDSSTMLYAAVKKIGVKSISNSFNNHWDTTC